MKRYVHATISSDDVIAYVEDMACGDWEAGMPVEDYKEFSKVLTDEGFEPSQKLYNMYLNIYEDCFNERNF